MPSPSPLAGQPAPASLLIDVDRLIAAYHDDAPDPSSARERVTFGTSGHRGSPFERTFNEAHVLAIAQAVCEYRATQGIDGPLFLGFDTHAVSRPAAMSTLEVCAANGVQVLQAENDAFTPTPSLSLAILAHNRGRSSHLADGILVTPSHNPPKDGGIKYNPPHGGPAGTDATKWIERRANDLLAAKLDGVRRMPYERASAAETTGRYDFLNAYVDALGDVLDLEAVARSQLRLGVDPLGGAGVHYWPAIAERYALDLTVVNDAVDPTFGFMTVDADGQIRMDPSSPYAMARLDAQKDRFDVSFACDPDHDRHGIVVPGEGLLPPNHYLSVAVDYLVRQRPQWPASIGVAKSVVTTRMIDRVAAELGRRLVETPVGFKWFVDGLLDGSLGFAGEESAGASFARRDGAVWTTEKDGIAAALLAAEMTAVSGRHPGLLYADLEARHGSPVAKRVDAPAKPEQMKKLAALSPSSLHADTIGGERVDAVVDKAPGNGEAIGGIRVSTANAWFAARPSGTEPLYKVYAESFVGEDHLRRVLEEAQRVVDAAIAS